MTISDGERQGYQMTDAPVTVALLAAVLNPQNWLDPVTCEECGFACVHLCGVAVKQGTKVTTVTNERVVTQECQSPSERGSRIAIAYECEEGCRYVVVLAFHKGSIYSELHHIDEESLPSDHWFTLWRD